jgi:alcohol dehydrogenase class IV
LRRQFSPTGYRPGTIHFGRGCADDLARAFADWGNQNVLVVTGTNVGSNEAVMGPVTDGLGGRSVDVFDETTPAKTLDTAFDGIERATRLDADVVVGVGGGSSLSTSQSIAS